MVSTFRNASRVVNSGCYASICKNPVISLTEDKTFKSDGCNGENFTPEVVKLSNHS